MDIPYCYDPVYQAERREAEWDRYSGSSPRCSCCGDRILSGNRRYELLVNNNCLNVCESCKDQMLESEYIVEDIEYGTETL